MAWKVRLSSAAQRTLDQLDPPVAKRVLTFLHERVESLDSPRSIGQPLKGSRLGEFWKYRVGDIRVIARIEDSSIEVLVVRIGNRREIYR
jgi:mRNA interferase RelE/StbE